MSYSSWEPGDMCPECLTPIDIGQEHCYCSVCIMPPCHSCGWTQDKEENLLEVNKMKRVVEVKFRQKDSLSDKSYAYLTDIENLAVGDWALVVVSEEPVAVKITEIHPSDDSRAKANKWIAAKIDLTEYHKKVKRQQLITEIERELDEQVKKVQRYEIFKACAKNSPKMQELLSKLGELDPSINLIEGEVLDGIATNG